MQYFYPYRQITIFLNFWPEKVRVPNCKFFFFFSPLFFQFFSFSLLGMSGIAIFLLLTELYYQILLTCIFHGGLKLVHFLSSTLHWPNYPPLLIISQIILHFYWPEVIPKIKIAEFSLFNTLLAKLSSTLIGLKFSPYNSFWPNIFLYHLFGMKLD